MLNHLYLTLSFLFLVNAGQPLEQCGGPLAATEFDDIVAGAAYGSRCTFPTEKLTVDCLLSSCPNLSGVCPINSNRSIDPIASKNAVSILNTCIGQNKLICGFNMSHIPTAQLSFTTKHLFPANVTTGNVKIIPGSSYLNNLSLTHFTLIGTDGPKGFISLSILAPYVVKRATFSGAFDILNSSFLQPLKGLLPALTSLRFPNVMGSLCLNISADVSIDPSTSEPAINILDDRSTLTVNYSNFVGSNGLFRVVVAQGFVDGFNREMEAFFRASVITASTVNFLSTYALIGFKAAQLNCTYLRMQ